jgi:hypothetical protein
MLCADVESVVVKEVGAERSRCLCGKYACVRGTVKVAALNGRRLQ